MTIFEKLNIKIKDKATGEILEPYEIHLSTTSIDVKVQINKDNIGYYSKTLSCYKNFPEDDEFELIED